MYHGVWVGRVPPATWCLRRARVGGAGLAADARTPQRRLQALPPAPFTVQRAGKPNPCKKSVCEIPYHAGAALEEQTWGARQPHKHRGVSKHEFPLSLHIRGLEQKKGKLSQPHVL